MSFLFHSPSLGGYSNRAMSTQTVSGFGLAQFCKRRAPQNDQFRSNAANFVLISLVVFFLLTPCTFDAVLSGS